MIFFPDPFFSRPIFDKGFRVSQTHTPEYTGLPHYNNNIEHKLFMTQGPHSYTIQHEGEKEQKGNSEK